MAQEPGTLGHPDAHGSVYDQMIERQILDPADIVRITFESGRQAVVAATEFQHVVETEERLASIETFTRQEWDAVGDRPFEDFGVTSPEQALLDGEAWERDDTIPEGDGLPTTAQTISEHAQDVLRGIMEFVRGRDGHEHEHDHER